MMNSTEENETSIVQNGRERIMTNLDRVRGRFPILLAYGFVALLVVWAAIEGLGWTNWITFSLPLSGPNFAQIASGVGTVVLSFGLLLLYDRQTEIQEQQTEIQEQQTEIQDDQESLMKQQFTPFLTGEVTPLNITSAQFQIRNTGNGPAYDVEAKWEVAEEERTWEIPSLPPGESFGFPVIVDGDNWLLETGTIQEYLEEHDASPVIEFNITCNNRFDEQESFQGTVDFDILITRSESDEIWSEDPLKEMSRSMDKLRRDMRKMKRYEKKSHRASNWQYRIQQTETIRQLVHEHSELTVEQLNRLTAIKEANIKYRLQALNDAGALHYNENTEKAKAVANPQVNGSLTDF